MAEIRPFQGVRYNQQKINNLAEVICPPYDIISPQQQDKLYQRSEYNFIRIEYNRELPVDNERNNRYTRACFYLSQWLEQGILKMDALPAIYIHEHYFGCLGESYSRRNIVVRVRLEDWDQKIILPHENIIPKAKSDRLSMLNSCQANISEVLALYNDPRKIISEVVSSQSKNEPLIDLTDDYGERHKVWAITQMEALKQIEKQMANQPLYIADGHHRYDSALTFKREMSAKYQSLTGDEGFNFVMMSLIDFKDPGMVILPTHRLLRGISETRLKEFKSQLRKYFDIQDISLEDGGAWQKVDSLLTGTKPDMQQIRLGIFGLNEGNISVLTLRELSAINQFMPESRSDLYKRLDVSIVDHVMLESLLGFEKDKEENALIYSHDRIESINQVRDHQYQLAFILNPVRPELIKAIADIGERMPRKSTYFYPKAPAGLVFYKW